MQNTKWSMEGLMKGNSHWIIPVDKNEILIGRSTECSLILQAPSVSRKHSLIRLFGEGVYLKDLGSRNGTFVNGVRIIEEKQLRNNDIIRLGELEFRLRELDENEEKTRIDAGKEIENEFIHHYGLSGREEEVLYLLLKGLKTKEIAKKLFISQGTAKNHVLSIYAKTDCHSRIEIARKFQEY
ncbi:FHA domain-containing protein [Oceanispirochaeta sp.]|jgi:pSer/pThr/pTyr-binding forkhead associated (FHA) protein|uniref:FHA domain-containing protein n=1 Tax=Oceanispirochaeta sp. TaxID=2035350 RepID=UPI0026314024|nr:FHA domain-containing protein [Oceanispirochaeta sp.]MDA3957138.1 FHA domain-containing protein [Oceanispirochaeta sp.]